MSGPISQMLRKKTDKHKKVALHEKEILEL